MKSIFQLPLPAIRTCVQLAAIQQCCTVQTLALHAMDSRSVPLSTWIILKNHTFGLQMNVMIRTMPQLLILRYYCMVLESTIQN